MYDENGSKNSHQRKIVYRELLETIQNIDESDDIGVNTVNVIGTVLDESHKLVSHGSVDDRIKHVDELLLDATVLQLTSNVIVKCYESLDVGVSAYEANEFAKFLVQRLDRQEQEDVQPNDFVKLLPLCKHIVPEIPQLKYLYGLINPESVVTPQVETQKEKKVVERRKLGEKKEPEKIINCDKEDTNVEETVDFIRKTLKQVYKASNCKPVNYYQFVIDTSSFEITVENIFYCAFLLRDGVVKLDTDRLGNLTLEPVKRSILDSFRAKEAQNTQMISSINIAEWQNLKDQIIGEGFIAKYKAFALEADRDTSH